MHIFVAVGGYTKLVQRVTSFAGEIFGFFISIAYIYLGLRSLVNLFPTDLSSNAGDNENSVSMHLASAYASIVLAIVMYMQSMAFHHSKQWRTWNPEMRWLFSNFGLVLTIVVLTLISFVPIFDNPHIDLPRLVVPDESSGPVPSQGRGNTNWVINLLGGDGSHSMEPWMIFVAILPGLMLLILFFFDHNVSSIMAQDEKFHLVKPPSFNWDFAVLRRGVILCGMCLMSPCAGPYLLK